MTETEQDRSTRNQSEGRPITDRFWKTLSGTLKSVGSDDRVRAAVNSMVGEESLRAVVQSLLPKDAAQSLRGSLDDFLENLRTELIAFLSQRADRFLEDFNIHEEFGKFLSESQIEIHATISVHPKGSKANKKKSSATISLQSPDTKPAPAPEPDAKPKKKSASETPRKKKTTPAPKKTAKAQPKKKTATGKARAAKKASPPKKRTPRKKQAIPKG